jgi:multimeric flavodoxin WrbA
MKILGISGGHRLGGNTDGLVEKALSVCRERGCETEFVSLASLKIGFCTSCGSCRKSFTCSIKDDVFPILEKMRDADALIVGTPTYFAQVSGRLKAFFDRTIPLRRNGMMLSGKVGGAIAVGGSRNGGQEKAASGIIDWMLLNEMVVVSDKKTAHFGGIAVGREPGDALKDEAGVATVVNLSEKIVETLERLGD